jgi:hypothetical protein
VTLARKRCSFSAPENLCYGNTGKRGADFDVKNPSLPGMTGRKNRDTLLTENDRFWEKEVCLMDPGNPEDRDRIRIFRNEAGRFCDLPEIFVKNGSCHAC